MAADRASSAPDLLALLEMDQMTLSAAGRTTQSRADRWMRYLGFPGGLLVFVLAYYVPFGPGLSAAGQAGIACFLVALIWWVTEPFPTYVTSLALMFLLLTTRVAAAKPIMDVLGLEVIWLNLLAFILSSMLVKTRLARRLGETQSFISKCERGERRIDVVELRAFCKALGISFTTFVRRLDSDMG